MGICGVWQQKPAKICIENNSKKHCDQNQTLFDSNCAKVQGKADPGEKIKIKGKL